MTINLKCLFVSIFFHSAIFHVTTFGQCFGFRPDDMSALDLKQRIIKLPCPLIFKQAAGFKKMIYTKIIYKMLEVLQRCNRKSVTQAVMFHDSHTLLQYVFFQVLCVFECWAYVIYTQHCAFCTGKKCCKAKMLSEIMTIKTLYINKIYSQEQQTIN